MRRALLIIPDGGVPAEVLARYADLAAALGEPVRLGETYISDRNSASGGYVATLDIGADPAPPVPPVNLAEVFGEVDPAVPSPPDPYGEPPF